MYQKRKKIKYPTDKNVLRIIKKFLHDYQVVGVLRTTPVQEFWIAGMPRIEHTGACRITLEGYKLRKWELKKKNKKGG